MRFYLGTSLSNYERQRELAQLLTELGHVQTLDWSVWAEGDDRPSDEVIAEQDLLGVAAADFVVIMLPGGIGTHFELGAAVALGKKVYLYAESEDRMYLRDDSDGLIPRSAFYAHPKVERFVGYMGDLAMHIDEWAIWASR